MCIIRHIHVLRCDVRPLATVAWDPTKHLHTVAVDPYSPPLHCETEASYLTRSKEPFLCASHRCCTFSYDILLCKCVERSSASQYATNELLARSCPCHHDYHLYSQLGGSTWHQLPVLDGWITNFPVAPAGSRVVPGVVVPCTPESYRLERQGLLENATALRHIIPVAVRVSNELATMIHAIERWEEPGIAAEFHQSRFPDQLAIYLAAEASYRSFKARVRLIDMTRQDVPVEQRLPELDRQHEVPSWLDTFLAKHPMMLRFGLGF